MASPVPTKKESLSHLLKEWGARYRYVSYSWVRTQLAQEGLHFPAHTLRDYLSEAMAKGVIHHSGRGWYSAIPEPAVLDQTLTDPVRQDLIKRFPFLPHYVWSTLQINPWMHHALGKFVTFVYAEGDGANDVSEFLRQEGWTTLVNPTRKTGKDLAGGDRVVVVRGLRRRFDARIEPRSATVLVDLLLENQRLGLMDEEERREMSRKLLTGRRVEMGGLLARLRDHKLKLEDLIGPPIKPIIAEI
jgi:hypothetical protein